MTAIRKAAVVLLSLDKALAAQVMAQMGEQDVQSLTKEIAGLEEVASEERDAAVEEFYTLGLAHLHMEQGEMENARDLLEQSLGKEQAGPALDRVVLARSVLDRSAFDRTVFDRPVLNRPGQSLSSMPFGFLQKLRPANLSAFIAQEHPQTIALVLSRLPANLAAQVLAGLPSTRQLDVVRRVATMEPARPDVLDDIEKGLESRMQAMFHQPPERASGVTSVAQMLNVTDRMTNKSILTGLGQENPELVDQIRRLMFVFDDLLKLDDRSIQKLVEEIELPQWALSLKGASEKLKSRILANLSPHDAALLQDEMGDLGPVRVSDVETAQQAIVAEVYRLEEAGEIVVAGEAQRLPV